MDCTLRDYYSGHTGKITDNRKKHFRRARYSNASNVGNNTEYRTATTTHIVSTCLDPARKQSKNKDRTACLVNCFKTLTRKKVI